jgi:hypothetical protein
MHWDQRWVQISEDGGPFRNILQLADDETTVKWLQNQPVDLSPYASKTIRVRFLFESLDGAFNTYSGWTIDDVSIDSQLPATCSGSDNTLSAPARLDYGGSTGGAICPNGDLDYYQFTGKAGDQVGVWVDTPDPSSLLDPYVYLFDRDGASQLARNDDMVANIVKDSFLGYRLPADGTYWLKLKAWNHPAVGSNRYSYEVKLFKDSQSPAGEISFPQSEIFLPTSPFTITVTAADEYPGVGHVEILWHTGDWQGSDWVSLGSDWDASNGWGVRFDPSEVPDQNDIAIYAKIYDWAGNWTGVASWNLMLDRRPPNNWIYLPVLRK